jgi:hypothetical protein
MLAIAVCVLWIGWFILKTKFCESYPRQPEIRCALQMARVGQSSAGVEKHIPDGRPRRKPVPTRQRARSSKPTVDGEQQLVLFDRP